MSDMVVRKSSKEARKSFISVDFEIFGKVQGVFFRKYVQQKGEELGIRGWCKNSSRGTVIGVLQGEAEQVEKIMRELRRKYAFWSWDDIRMEDRLESLQRGLDQLNETMSQLGTRLDEQMSIFESLRGDLAQLELKVTSVLQKMAAVDRYSV